MPADLGTPFTAIPTFTHVRDLEEFEGPILSELRSSGGAVYLEKWCAYHNDAVRTLVVRSDQRSIAEYLARRSTMLELLTKPNDDTGFLLDMTEDGAVQAQLVQVSSLPTKYLPKPTAMHEESLRPRWEKTPQTFLVDAEWDAKLLSDLEKNYLTVYAFDFFTDVESDKSPPRALTTYILDGPYAYGALFRTLRKSVPKNDNAKATGVAAASPGVLTIAAPTEIADRIGVVLAAAASDRAEKAYENLHRWSRMKPHRADEIPPTAEDQIRRLCEILNVEAAKILPSQEDVELTTSQLLRAGKVIAAYYRALWRLLQPKQNGVEFLAPSIARAKSDPPPSIVESYDDDEDNDEDEEEDEEDDTQF